MGIVIILGTIVVCGLYICYELNKRVNIEFDVEI